MASAPTTAHAIDLRREGSERASAKHTNDAPPRSARSAYARASCEYQMSIGLTAASAAAARPIRTVATTPSRCERDGYDERSRERRERPQRGFVAADDLRPGPSENVVERRRRLRVEHATEDVDQRSVEQRRRDRLVVPVALLVERREAKRRADPRQQEQRHAELANGRNAITEVPPSFLSAAPHPARATRSTRSRART